MEHCDVAIVGAGQAGLATAYYLRRTNLSFVLLDAHPQPGGSWPDTWSSLRLFSPWRISSLPGWRLPPTKSHYPTPAEIADYFRRYEQHYSFDVRRPARVVKVSGRGPFAVTCADGSKFRVRAVVNATGNASRPFIPHLPGMRSFQGQLVHSHDYRNAAEYADKAVIVVGGGNSGAQIATDLYVHAQVTWCTLRPPRFLPDSYDGEALFSVAKQRLATIAEGREDTGGLASLGDIVVTPPIGEARKAGTLRASEMFTALTPSGVRFADGAELRADAVIWCTGFRPALKHLNDYRFSRDSSHHIKLNSTESVDVPRLYFVGYGDWVGPAADTIVGVSPFAKEAARSIAEGVVDELAEG